MLRLIDKFFLIPLLAGGILVSLNFHKKNYDYAMMTSDSEGYYLYLPAVFIYHSFDHVTAEKEGLNFVDCCGLDSITVQDRYPYGAALLETPFFLVGHAYASWFMGPSHPAPENFNHPPEGFFSLIFTRGYTPERGQATGWSPPYMIAIMIAAAFYVALGLWFVKEILKRYFTLPVALLTPLVILLGTNLYYYSYRAAGMSHVYSFFLFAAFLWQLPRFFENPGWKRCIWLGLTFGLICVTRPTNCIIGFLFFLFDIYSWQQFKARIKWLAGLGWKLLLMAGMVFLMAIPQMIFYKIMYGSALTWSYGKEGFDYWNHPQVGNVLFSHQNGFFMYAPVLLLMAPGLVIAWKNKTGSPFAVLVIFMLATYIFASWWAWWFGGAFGHRCYVEYLALLALPLASFTQWVLQFRKKLATAFYILVLIFFMHGNVKLSYLYTRARYPWDGPEWTPQKYWKHWGRVMSLFQEWN